MKGSGGGDVCECSCKKSTSLVEMIGPKMTMKRRATFSRVSALCWSLIQRSFSVKHSLPALLQIIR